MVKSSISYTLGVNIENLTLIGARNINGTGNSAKNIITGNSLDNTIDGATGADTMIGGVGNDTYMVDNIGDAVTELFNEGVDMIKSSISYALGANLENLMLTDVVDNIGDVFIELVNERTDMVKASTTDVVASYLEDLRLTIAGTINGTGNSANNKIVGNSAANILTGGAGADLQTGSGGADTFRFIALSDSSLTSLDQITDLSIGTDILDAPTAVTAENTKELGIVKTFDQAGIAAVLNEAVFGPNQAATFSYDLGIGTKTFIALNDNTAGFSSTSDCLIEITGYTGLLTDLSIV
jgi:Ca2+-binding RTX toxin-like protein